MATALTPADRALNATDGKANFHRLTRLLVCGGITLLRELFDFIHPPVVLPIKLGDPTIEAKLQTLRHRNFLTRLEWNQLYPSTGVYGTSKDFDITLLFKLFRNICGLTSPGTGWDDLPNITDLSLEADLVRIKYYRNNVYGHSTTMEIADREFVDLWREISEALLRIAGTISNVKRFEWQIFIDTFLHDPLIPDAERDIAELDSWYKNDTVVKDELEKLRKEMKQMNIAQEEKISVVINIITEIIEPNTRESFGSVIPGHLPDTPQRQEAQFQPGVSVGSVSQESQTEDATARQYTHTEVQVNCQQFLKNISVPIEMKARERRAQLAYENALRAGEVNVYRARIMLIGQDRAGKTSLKRAFLGLPLDLNEQSTDGIEVDPSVFEIDVDRVKNWQRMDSEVGVSQFANDLAKMVAEQLKQEKANLVPEVQDEPKKVPFREEMWKVQQPQSSGHIAFPSENAARDFVMPRLKIDRSQPPEEFTQLVIQYLNGLNLPRDTASAENHMILDLWDFAGQHLYYASHPVFMSSRAVYLLVHNFSKELKNTAEPCVRLGNLDTRLKNSSGETNMENLLSWLVSVKAVASVNSAMAETTLPYLRPPVFIVGTHADKPCRSIKEIEFEIRNELRGNELDGHVIRDYFAVDNNKGSSDDGIRALQKRLIDVLKQEPYMGQKVPLRWFNFEKITQTLVAQQIYWYDLKELKNIIQTVCFVDSDEEVSDMLDFYHGLGIIVKHGSTVVFRATWLADVFKRLITICPQKDMASKHSILWEKMERSGVLDMELVDHVFSEFCQQGLNRDDILGMMEQFGLIVKFESPQNGLQYFVPAQLKTPPKPLLEAKPSSSDPCALYAYFEGGFVPHGFYLQLVSRCFRWCSKSGFTKAPKLFEGASQFFINKECLCQLILLCKKRFIKIILRQIKPGNVKASLVEAQVRKTAIFVREFLEDTLLNMSKSELRVECPYCPREENTCRKHGVVRCTQSDCICLLELPSDGQLEFCWNSFSDEIEILPGLERWFSVEGVAFDEIPTSASSKRRSSISSPQNSKPMKKTLYKEGVPCSKELEGLSMKLANSWRFLGRQLEFDDAALDGIDHDKHSLRDKAYEMLTRWKQREGSNATYSVLGEALCHPHVQNRELAEKVCCTTVI